MTEQLRGVMQASRGTYAGGLSQKIRILIDGVRSAAQMVRYRRAETWVRPSPGLQNPDFFEVQRRELKMDPRRRRARRGKAEVELCRRALRMISDPALAHSLCIPEDCCSAVQSRARPEARPAIGHALNCRDHLWARSPGPVARAAYASAEHLARQPSWALLLRWRLR